MAADLLLKQRQQIGSHVVTAQEIGDTRAFVPGTSRTIK
jgi:hypothetical protein